MSDPKIRFSDVAYAIGTTPKSLRNWLVRDQVKLSSTAPDKGWREFDLQDVPKLALIRSIVDFGIEVRDADRLAGDILRHGDVNKDAATFKIELPGLGVEFEMPDYCAALWPVPDENDWALTTFNIRDATPSLSHAPATFVLRVGRIVMFAVQRVNERVSG